MIASRTVYAGLLLALGCSSSHNTDDKAPSGSASATALLGPRGGVIRAGAVSVLIPPDALSMSTQVTAHVTWADPCAQRIELSPDGTTFRTPVELRVQIPKHCMGPGVTTSLAWKQNGRFVPLPTRVDVDGHMTTELMHFSPYGSVAYTTHALDFEGVQATHNGLDLTLASGARARFTGFFTGSALVLTLRRAQPTSDTLILGGLLATDT